MPYRREVWTTLLPDILPGVELFRQPIERPLTTEAEKRVATALYQIGRATVRDKDGAGRFVALFETTVAARVNIAQSRVALRQLVTRCIDESSAHAVLAFFVHPDREKREYRLTYAARESVFGSDGQVETRETATKRYTFVLGPGETRRTAAQRLAGLAEKRATATLQDVTDAFSVEKLNDEFFETYKEHYQAFCQHLLASDAPTRMFRLNLRGLKDKELDKAWKRVRDFVKKLLGRLVFLHFLQKKGWMGCPAGQAGWRNGEPEFLRKLFDACADKARFHSRTLVPLFFDTLNNPKRAGDLFSLTETRIPYLNGGLFERDFAGVEQIDFPEVLFAGLLGFFGQYNFTIDENDPDDHEIGIDPEMLGHIFENLLEDNKDKGAYYTPKAIVQYMCQQSLIHYLQGHFPGDPAASASIERLIRFKEPIDARHAREWLPAHATEIERLLDAVKICDPAIGSGAFPIGILQEIYWTKLTLHPGLDRAKAKRDIIQNSLYGVDIDAGAVEIARLRCWLALIVEETQPRPLPNLDFKIMQGDSLLESFEGIPLDQLMPSVRPLYEQVVKQQELDLGPAVRERQQLELSVEERERFAGLLATYFPCEDPVEKARLHAEIDAFVLRHLDFNVDQYLRHEEEDLAKLQADIDEKRGKLRGYKPSPRELRRIKLLQADIRANRARKAKLHALADTPERPYFLWHLFFQDVFARGGFDIVIANPPYVRMELFKHLKEILREQYSQVYAERADLYCYFYARALELLREKGVLCFISSNKFIRGGYGEKLRTHLITNTELQTVVDFGDLPIFEATTYPCILFAVKGLPRPGHDVRTVKVEREADIPRVRDLPGLPQAQQGFSWRLEDPVVLALLRKLKSGGQPLANVEHAAIYRGVVSGLNDAFIIQAQTRASILAVSPSADRVLKPYLGGRNVRRWACDYPDLWMLYLPHGVDTEGLEAVLQHLRPFRDQLEARATEQKWYELQQPQEKFVRTYDAPKIIFPDIAADLRFALDTRGAYFSNTAYCIASSDMFLLAVLNSSCTQFFYRHLSAQFRGGYLRFWTQYVEQIPVPVADGAMKDHLRNLARRAAKAAGSELATIEAEINRIVYRLFKLEPDEIALIEGATVTTKPALDHKTALFSRILPELAAAAPYFPIETVKRRLAELQVAVADVTLQGYLSEAMAKGIVHDAGRGWYSPLAEALALDVKPVKWLVARIEKKFPMLTFSCWSTEQINPYMHHLLAKFVTFVNVDRDLMATVFYEMRGWRDCRVYLDPKGVEAKRFQVDEKTVVIRPRSAHEAEAQGHAAPVERMLVDLAAEVEDLALMSHGEFQDAAWKAVTSGRVPMSALLRYLERRRLKAVDVFGGNWPSSVTE